MKEPRKSRDFLRQHGKDKGMYGGSMNTMYFGTKEPVLSLWERDSGMSILWGWVSKGKKVSAYVVSSKIIQIKMWVSTSVLSR